MQNIFNLLKTNAGSLSQLSQLNQLKNLSSDNDPNSQVSPSNKTIRIPTKNDLLIMLRKEELIRSSPEYIAKCDEVSSEPNGWLRISKEYQYQIAREHGYITDMEADIAVNHMRRASILYPDEPLFKTIPVYVRNNLASAGNLIAGTIVPNIIIHKNNSTHDEIKLYNTFDPTKMNLLIASSHT